MRILDFFETWLCQAPPLYSVRPAATWTGEAKADACASGKQCAIGGFLKYPNGVVSGFSEQYVLQKFLELGIPLCSDLQRDIVFLEALAQLALVHVLAKGTSHSRFAISLPSCSDNSGVECRVNSLFSTSKPLCFLLEGLSFMSAERNTILDVSHVSGVQNVEANFLSRWDQVSDFPQPFSLESRIRLFLQDLWQPVREPSFYPSHMENLNCTCTSILAVKKAIFCASA